MKDGYELSVDGLVMDELDGKATAIANYDQMLWKIRSGYAVFIYAAIGVIAGLVNSKAVSLNLSTALALFVLIGGFSGFAALLDYSFMTSKLRVVTYRDELTRIACEMASDKDRARSAEQLLDCLQNSGERQDPVNWNRWTGLHRPVLLYGGTSLVCLLAITVLVASRTQSS